ncbi:hypothetical protein PspLS_09755 [Pyricularia sp. CBS 133598]|nr:hypothetical protein PspLS_09755 [Pyricularia sp. CBS 133598]
MSCIVVHTIVIAMPSSAVYLIVTLIRTETGLTLTDIHNGTGIMLLFYGWGCVFWGRLSALRNMLKDLGGLCIVWASLAQATTF